MQQHNSVQSWNTGLQNISRNRPYIFVLFYVMFVLLYVLFVLCHFVYCLYVCTGLLPLGGNPIAV